MDVLILLKPVYGIRVLFIQEKAGTMAIINHKLHYSYCYYHNTDVSV